MKKKFFLFLALISFVITCSFILFFTYMDVNKEQLPVAALFTFGNVVFMTLILLFLDNMRRKIFVDRPVKRIKSGLDKITKGEFDTRIETISDISGMADFNEIIMDINTMAAELSGVETLRNDFVSNVSHEMKTPIAAIRNYAKLLKEEGLSDKERLSYAESIDAAAGRLSDLIVNILKLNKLENQQIFPDAKEYDVSEQLCECLLAYEDVWNEKGIDLETDIDDEIRIVADPNLLGIVWNNLLSNAFKFTEKGKVLVKAEYRDGKLRVVISDSGCGMDEETIKHIFEKFYQGDSSRARYGNGLGLSLVKRIVDILGGSIEVSSKIGEGSTFEVTF